MNLPLEDLDYPQTQTAQQLNNWLDQNWGDVRGSSRNGLANSWTALETMMVLWDMEFGQHV